MIKMVGKLKKWFFFLTLISVLVGILADEAEDHQKILELQSEVRKLKDRADDLEEDMDNARNTTDFLTMTVRREGDLQEELAKDLNKVNDKAIKTEQDVDTMRGELTGKVVSLEKQLDDQKKAAEETAKKLEEKLVNATLRMEEKFAVQEQTLVTLRNIVSTHEGKINEMEDKESDMNKKLHAIIAMLPNSTHLNISDDLTRRVDSLERKVDLFHDDFQSQLNQLMTVVSDIREKDIEQIKNNTVVEVKELKNQLGYFSEEIIATRAEIADVQNSTLGISGAVTNLKTEMLSFGQLLSQAKEDLTKYIPDVYGFKYTGPGWSLWKDQVTKYYINLEECLKFCKMKQGLDRRYDGVNYITNKGRAVCYCLKGAHGFKPMKDSLRFIAA